MPTFRARVLEQCILNDRIATIIAMLGELDRISIVSVYVCASRCIRKCVG